MIESRFPWKAQAQSGMVSFERNRTKRYLEEEHKPMEQMQSLFMKPGAMESTRRAEPKTRDKDVLPATTGASFYFHCGMLLMFASIDGIS